MSGNPNGSIYWLRRQVDIYRAMVAARYSEIAALNEAIDSAVEQLVAADELIEIQRGIIDGYESEGVVDYIRRRVLHG